MRRPSVPWPDGARVAVNIHLVLEAWGVPAEAGGGLSPAFPRELLEAGRRDWAGDSWRSYGGQTGFYRLMEVLREDGVQGPAADNGLGPATRPDVAGAIGGPRPAGSAHPDPHKNREFPSAP